MLTKNDCLSILVRLEDDGVTDAKYYTRKLLLAKEPPVEVLKFIASQQGIEASNFYEMLRKSHNQKKSPLYTNILRSVDDTKEVVTTLSCMITQILLYGSKLENPSAFYSEIRAEEISRVLNDYFATGSIEKCLLMLQVVKSDLLVLEYLAGRRDIE